MSKCPGSLLIRQPVPELANCPCCGYEIEIWSDEAKAKCRGCGKYYMKGMSQNCLDWCAYARECVGDEAYEKYLREKEESVLTN
jgi:hypothetical protein